MTVTLNGQDTTQHMEISFNLTSLTTQEGKYMQTNMSVRQAKDYLGSNRGKEEHSRLEKQYV